MQNTSQKNIKGISLSDLINLSKLKEWVRKHINIYNEKEIPSNHLVSIVEYIEREIQNPEFPHERIPWLDAINKLKDAIIKYDRFKERHREDTEEVS